MAMNGSWSQAQTPLHFSGLMQQQLLHSTGYLQLAEACVSVSLLRMDWSST